MKSKPMGALFGVLALVAILSVAPAFGQTANEVDMAKGAGASQTADCVAANNCFNPNPLTVASGTQVTWKNTDTVSHTVTSGKGSDNQTGTVFDSGGFIKTRRRTGKDTPVLPAPTKNLCPPFLLKKKKKKKRKPHSTR